jgi:tRNA-dihydrouridine synthase B
MFRVGDLTIDPPLVLAPMEDVTSQPMRRIAKRIAGPGLVVTEFVSAMAVHYNAKKTIHKMRLHPEERPVAIQIFGGEPETMAESARLAESMGADIVDINMGCWVPKVCKTGAGAALLKDPELAERIVRSVVNAVKVPVTSRSVPVGTTPSSPRPTSCGASRTRVRKCSPFTLALQSRASMARPTGG